jgi:hypothetical protein
MKNSYEHIDELEVMGTDAGQTLKTKDSKIGQGHSQDAVTDELSCPKRRENGPILKFLVRA